MIARLVHHENPEARPTPLLLLGHLRTIDPAIELVYTGDRKWWLGAVSSNGERYKRGETILRFESMRDVVKRNPRNIMLGQLLLQGFALIEAYIDHGDVAGECEVENGTDSYRTTIYNDLLYRQQQWEKDQGRSNMLKRLRKSGREDERQAGDRLMREYLANDGRDHYRRIMKGKMSVQVDGSRDLILPPSGGSGLVLTLNDA